MRIIGGTYRGKNLLSPKTDDIRPTSDKARESVFNILYSKLNKPWDQINLADIFTGSGAFGLEAVSRGARSVALIDIDTASAAKNVALFPNEKDKITLIRADAASLPRPKQVFDIIFMDAPYHKGLSEQALLSILKNNWLAPDGICVIETATDEKIEIPQPLKLVDERRYGIAKFWFLTFEN